MGIRVNVGSLWYSILFILTLQSCGKTWLDAKPDKSLVVPGSVTDFQLLLDNSAGIFNINQACGLGEISAGDFYMTYTSWQSLFNVQEKSAYTWAKTTDFYNNEYSLDWANGYRRILNANVVLDGIDKIKPLATEEQAWNNVKGSALFFRAFDYFNLSQEYCVTYNAGSATTDLGLPLRLEYNVNVKVNRSSVQNTYDRILADLKEAVPLLVDKPLFKTRPSRQAAYALLARTYLSMESYNLARLYADSALQIQSDLMDFNQLNAASSYPILRFNSEVIFQSTFSYGAFGATRLIVDPILYSSYANEDCRKSLYFLANSNGVTFKGNYSGDKNLFGGLAINELYLIRAECRLRNGALAAGLSDINALLKKRWKGNYRDFGTDDINEALTFVLKERRKELVFRGLRWTDLRRLNKDLRFAVTLTRTLNNSTYTLPPGDKKYAFPIDEEEIRLSGIQQNDR